MRGHRLILVAAAVALLAPGAGRANPLAPVVNEVSPPSARAGSGDLEVVVSGEGFLPDTRAVAVAAGSALFVDGALVPRSYVLDDHTLVAEIPASMLAEPGIRNLQVRSGVLLPASVTPIESNFIGFEVLPAAIELSLNAPPENPAGSCFEVAIEARDSYGNVAGQGISVVLSSDDLATEAAGDGHIVFSWDCTTPIEGPIPLNEDEWPTYVYAKGLAAETARIAADAVERPLSASTDVRIFGGIITGRVLTEKGHQPVAGAKVYASYSYEEPIQVPGSSRPGARRLQAGGRAAASVASHPVPCPIVVPRPVPASHTWYVEEPVAVTGADGTFVSTALGPGGYTVRIEPPEDGFLVAEWLPDSTTENGAQPVAVVDGGSTDVEARLGLGGRIAGRVTSTSGSPIEEAVVEVLDLASGATLVAAHSAEDGRYTAPAVGAGSYGVRITAGPEYLQQYYAGAASIADATPVTVRTETLTGGIDAALVLGARITGTVTAAGEPVSGVILEVFGATDGSRRGYGCTDPDGEFRTLPGLPSGSYKVRALGTRTGLPTWYADASSFGAATAIALVEGEDRAIELELRPAALITGVITHDGAPAASAYVEVFDEAGRYASYGYTDSDGRYEAGPLEAGTYTLRFGSYENLAPEWYDNAPDRTSATRITLPAGGRATADADLATGGRITGRVLDASGAPVAERNVNVYVAGEPFPIAWGYTDPDGNYDAVGLATGSYLVQVTPGDATRPFAWYPSASSPATATPVAVIAGEASTADVRLGRASFIAGRVMAERAGPVATSVEIVDAASGLFVDWTFAEPDGTYRSNALAAGTYKLRFGGTENHAIEWNDGARTSAGAPAVATLADATTTVDAQLDEGVRISGTITAAHSGDPVPYSDAEIVDAATGEVLAYGQGRADGAWQSGPILPGDVKVRFFGSWPVYAEQWYDGMASFETATVVPVGRRGATGIDARLLLED